MTELSALNVRITGDAGDLKAELTGAGQAVSAFGAQAGRSTTGATGLSRAFGVLGSVSNQTRSRIQNTSFQLQDMAVQFQMGTRASIVLAQQLPQLAGGFGPVGAAIGVLAAIGIPALALAFADAGDEALTMADRLDVLKKVGDDLRASQDILEMSNADLVETYGRHAEAVRDAARAYAELAQAQARANLAENVSALADAFSDFTQTEAGIFSFGTTYTNAIGNVAEAFSVTREEARLIVDALTDVRDAMTFEDRMSALNALQQIFADTGVAAETIPPALREALLEANSLTIAMAEVAQQAENAADASNNILTGNGPVQTGRGTRAPRRAPREGEGPLAAQRPGRTNPMIAQLAALQDALLGQEQAEIASHERRLEQLRRFQEAHLITQEEYQELEAAAQKQHAERLAQIDVYRYGSGLQQAERFFGDMSTALASGNDRILRVSRTFAAVEALINAWRAYSQTIADPTLPWFAKIPAALSVLSAGMGAVNAIKGTGGGGGGGGGGGAAAGAGSRQTPLQATLNLTGPLAALFGGSIGGLLDQLNDEAGDRGYHLNLGSA